MKVIQSDLFGKKRKGFSFKKAFSPNSKEGSLAELKIASFLAARGISFRTHGRIAPKGWKGFSDSEKLSIINSQGHDPEITGALLKRTPIGKIRPELYRYDFLVEGSLGNPGKPRKIYVEYLGMYFPKKKFSKISLRRRHERALASYTLLKTPLKRALYSSLGSRVLEILPESLGKLDEILAPLKEIRQEKTTLAGYFPGDLEDSK